MNQKAKSNMTEQARYEAFVKALTEATQRYGIAMQSIGGVAIADTQSDFADLAYRADISSGDILPIWK